MSEVPVRDAATVVLLRDGADGIEAWLLTRVSQMAFAPNMTVFAGGRIDDTDHELPITGDVDTLAARFECSVETARALVGGAVRETFEETGVLLTVPPADPAVDLAAARTDVEGGVVSFADLLRRNGLSVDAGALRPWARWVTPAGEVRRYDTRFFVGALPVGAQARDVTSESSEASWVGVGAALEQAERGERQLLPPTVATLASLRPFATVAEALAASADRSMAATRPKLRLGEDGSVAVELPDGTVVPIPRSMLP